MSDLKIKLFLFFIIISADLYAVNITPLALIYQGKKQFSEVESLFEGQRVNENVAYYKLLFVIGRLGDDFISEFSQYNKKDNYFGYGIVNSSFMGRVKESPKYVGKICSSDTYFQFSESKVPYAIAIESNEKIDELFQSRKNKLIDQILKHFDYVYSLDSYGKLMTVCSENEYEEKTIYNFHDLKCGKYTEGANDCSRCRTIKQLGSGKFNTTIVTFFDKEAMDED